MTLTVFPCPDLIYYWSLRTPDDTYSYACHNIAVERIIFHLVSVMKLSSNLVPTTSRADITLGRFFDHEKRTSFHCYPERKRCGVDHIHGETSVRNCTMENVHVHHIGRGAHSVSEGG